MDFNWNEPKTIDDKEFSADNLGRAKYATYLTSLIKAKGGTNKEHLSNYVLNLDAEWGAGKTYFLKRWSNDLKGNHPVVYIDAWSIDYLDSPLMTVLSEIIEQLKKQTDKIDSAETAIKLKEVIKAASPRIGSALMKRYLGFDLNIFDSSESDGVITPATVRDIDFSRAGEKVFEVFCKEVIDSKRSVKTLKSAIQSWVEYVVEHPVKNMNSITKSFPAVIFIDELDRCKPTYAVEMLEAIKHVFDIPGLTFVVATNTSQLAHTVRAVYGFEFNAEEYLSRFFNNRYYLRTQLSRELIENHCNTKLINDEWLKSRQVILFPFFIFEGTDFLDFTVEIFEAVQLTPRQAIKVFERIQSAFLNLDKNSCINAAVMILLFALQEKSLKLFEDFFTLVIENDGIRLLREKYPVFGKVFVNIVLEFYIDTSFIRKEYKFIEQSEFNFNLRHMTQENLCHMRMSLYQLFKVSFDLGSYTSQKVKITKLLSERNPASLSDETFKFLMLFMQIKDKPSYYLNLTNMAVNLD
ncbi:P-loop NTPase fold protein [Pseudoalteromonas sp. Hal040]|uniref:KAP family P-loop NTPase fold protein n=1 Tax=unclassified Pseudoalteromonas TaxID=194690 RepID=UPI00301DE67A